MSYQDVRHHYEDPPDENDLREAEIKHLKATLKQLAGIDADTWEEQIADLQASLKESCTERDKLVLQIREAMEVCDAEDHKDHKTPKDCMVAWSWEMDKQIKADVREMKKSDDRANVAERLINELREIVDLAVDIGGVRFHEEGCPEDDTCDCPDVKRVNDAMGDFKSKRKPNSINLPTDLRPKDDPTKIRAHCGLCGGMGYVLLNTSEKR